MLEAKPKCQGLAVSKRGNERILGSAGRERQELVCHAGQRCAGHGVGTVRAAAGTSRYPWHTHGASCPLQGSPGLPTRALWLCFSAGFLHAPLGADSPTPRQVSSTKKKRREHGKALGERGSGEDGVPAFPGQLRPAHGLPFPPAPPAASVLPARPVAASPLPPTLPDGGPWL